MPRRLIVPLVLAVLLAAGVSSAARAPAARAQPAASYSISWYTVDAGGGTSAGANGYTLTGTAGQPDAGTLHSAGAPGSAYTLAGGFWSTLAQALHDLFLPLVRR